MSNSEFCEQLKRIYKPDQHSTQTDQLAVVSRDESSLPAVTPGVVVWPETADQVARTVRLCSEAKIPVTTRGAGSALEGSTIPLAGGLVLDLSRMNKLVEFWPQDLQVKVGPGIVYDDLNEQLKREGLFFPPSPGGSGDIATIGGMVATNASGIYSVKYGGTREFVLALDIVTGEGNMLTIGSRAVKRSSGYNLVDLVAGSEGTLAVITSITLRLAGLPEARLRSAFCFSKEVDAARAVSEIRRYGIDIAAVEFLDSHVLAALNKLKGFGLKEKPSLFLEFHGSTPATRSDAETVETLCRDIGGEPVELAEGQNPWAIRHWTTEAIKHAKPGYSIVRNDVVFPISRLPEMVQFCHELGDKHRLTMFTFGHVGMGLLHALMLARRDNPAEWSAAHQVNSMIVARSVEFGGSISGEHGIGLAHKDQFDLEHGSSVELMRKIKSQFDPKWILNPGKIFDQ